MEFKTILYDIVQTIWSSMLGFEAYLVKQSLTSDQSSSSDQSLSSVTNNNLITAANKDFITASLNCYGDWEALLTLSVSKNLASKAASKMFSIEEGLISFEQSKDAVGELANMMAGNLKSIMPGQSKLSLPNVVEGNGPIFEIPSTEILAKIIFDCQGDFFLVTLSESYRSKLKA